MFYRKLKRSYKKMSKIQISNDKKILDYVDYNSEQIFKIKKNCYYKLIYDMIFTMVIMTIFIFIALLALIKYRTVNNIYLLIPIIIFCVGIKIIICIGTYNKYKKVYPNIIIKYEKGSIFYCNSKQTYEFKVKSINSVMFRTPYYRSERWVISLSVKGSLDSIEIDILQMNNSELLYRLLTNFNKELKVY